MFVLGLSACRTAHRSGVLGRRGGTTRRRAALVGLALIAGLGSVSSSAGAAPTTMVDLGTASTYAALSGASIGNTVSAPGAPHTTLRGDLGVKANAEPTGFPPGVVTGAFDVGNDAATRAHADAATAYAAIAARTGGAPLAGALAGTTVPPGLHTFVGAASNTTTVTLDAGGDPNAVFVFQVNGALAMAAGSNVALTGGAQASRVFWQVAGAGSVGATAGFAGTLIARDAVGVGAGTIVNGRAIALGGALTLDANEVYSAPPVVTFDGGATATTTDTTPTISGTTDVQAPAVVTVTVNGQTLTAAPSGDTWSVTSAILANDTYPVVAAVRDGAGNLGSATQQLTVDTVPPVVTLDGGTSLTTNDPTPTISGTTDVATGTTVRVSVDAQTLTALVQAGGTWNVSPASLADGARPITATVSDPAGNATTARQTLTVDTVAPDATITGGATALTNDATPEIAGTADVEPGTAVTVTVSDQTLSGAVGADRSWTVPPPAPALVDGPRRVVATVRDAAGNTTTVTQILTVDTVAPLVTIAGGATATTSDVDPTIRGTSDAVPGTTVTVSLAGQTITTLLQANGTWNVTPANVGYGAWTIVASVPDPAGNVGSADQVLTVVAGAPPESEAPGTGDPVPPVVPALPDVLAPAVPPGTPTAPSAPPAPGGGGATTVTAQATVARSSRQKLKGSSLSIGTKVTAARAGRVVVTVSGTVKIKGVKRAIKLTTATRKLAAGKSATVKLELHGTSKAARTAFNRVRTAVRKGKQTTATITVKLVDAAGHTRRVQRTVKLTR